MRTIVLNEVLSLNAQECDIPVEGYAIFCPQ